MVTDMVIFTGNRKAPDNLRIRKLLFFGSEGEGLSINRDQTKRPS
jgi:hypothetical protein